MVVSAHPAASEVGVRVLQEGGNAVDAAIAALTMLNVVEPHASGLGGGGFLLYYDTTADSFFVIDYRERAPMRIKQEDYYQPDDTLDLARTDGASSVLVPGAAAGWQAMHDRFGSRVLSDLMAHAVATADTGFLVSENLSTLILERLEKISADSAMAKVFLIDGIPPPAGERIRQPELSNLLKFLSRTRIDNFYYPPVANDFLETVQSNGGTIRMDDLASYRVHERVPLRGSYHGYEIVTLPPPASGGCSVLEILKIAEDFNIQDKGFLSTDYIHTLALAARQASADAKGWIYDPDYNPVPVEQILSDEWITEARARMPEDSVPALVSRMDTSYAMREGNTTHLVVVDSAGNLVSLTQSINYFFGAGLMVPELGLLLNNHMADFSYDSLSPGRILPLRRPRSNMAPTIVRKDGKPVLVIGSPGGSRIAPTLAHVLIGLLDYHLPLNEVLDAPRFFPARDLLVVEERIPEETLNELTAKGWRIYPYGTINAFFGGVHAAYIDPETGSITGAADPRRDGAPAGY